MTAFVADDQWIYCENCGEKDPPLWHRCPKARRAVLPPEWREKALALLFLALWFVFVAALCYLVIFHP